MKKAAISLAVGGLMALAAGPFLSFASVSWDTDCSVAGAAAALRQYYVSGSAFNKVSDEAAESVGWSDEIQAAAVPSAQVTPNEVPTASVTASAYENIAISNVSNYVNVRTEPNTTSAIVGKIYNNCAATIEATVDGEGGVWYQIQSGTVKGYIKAEYFITGAEAEKIAKKVGTVYVKVSADTLRLREAPNTSSRILTLLSENDEYVSLRTVDEFVEIQVDADLTGYVHSDYVTERVEFRQAISLEQEAAQKAEEEKRKKEASEAIARVEALVKEAEAAQNAAQGSAAAESTAGPSAAETTTAGTETRATVEMETIAMNPENDSAGQSHLPDGNKTNTSNTVSAKEEPKSATEETSAKATGIGPGGSSGSGGISGPGGGFNDKRPGPDSQEITAATRNAIVAYAKQFLGNPYVYGGTSLTEGADCSGFTMRIYEHFGIDTGRTSRDQADRGKTISLNSIQPGDLIFYASGDYINHVAMYIGNGEVIHASTAATGIKISTAYYRTPYKAVTFLD